MCCICQARIGTAVLSPLRAIFQAMTWHNDGQAKETPETTYSAATPNLHMTTIREKPTYPCRVADGGSTSARSWQEYYSLSSLSEFQLKIDSACCDVALSRSGKPWLLHDLLGSERWTIEIRLQCSIPSLKRLIGQRMNGYVALPSRLSGSSEFLYRGTYQRRRKASLIYPLSRL